MRSDNPKAPQHVGRLGLPESRQTFGETCNGYASLEDDRIDEQIEDEVEDEQIEDEEDVDEVDEDEEEEPVKKSKKASVKPATKPAGGIVAGLREAYIDAYLKNPSKDPKELTNKVLAVLAKKGIVPGKGTLGVQLSTIKATLKSLHDRGVLNIK